MTSHYLYRCYDDAGRLVYIGCTSNVERRMAHHRRDRRTTASALLQRFMSRYEVDADTYRDAASGHAAERESIAAERPVFNLQHGRVPMWRRDDEVARYIYEQTGVWPATRFDDEGHDIGYLLSAADLRDLFSKAAA